MSQYIMLHHSATTDSGTVSWGAIERYHRQEMGWRDIGYHFGVERVGDSYYAVLGRPESAEGAACKEARMNKNALHICCVGNYDEIAPSEEMWMVLTKRVVAPLIKRYSIPVGNIVGHRDYAPYKSCPGKLFDLSKYRAFVMNHLDY